ncbi:MAG: Flp family type IVb pilin [Sneathiella sp.]
MKKLISLARKNCGATSIEYGLIAFLVGIAGIVAFTTTGAGIADMYTGVEDKFCDAVKMVSINC